MRIACVESIYTYNQFWDDGTPRTSPTGAVGVMQLTYPDGGKTCAHVWDWKANVNQGMQVLRYTRGVASRFHLSEGNVKADGITAVWNQDLVNCNGVRKANNLPNFTPTPLDATPQVNGSQQERQAARNYNKGREYDWKVDDTTTCAGHWASDPKLFSDRDYVNKVFGPNCP